jgi:hypothetical protein
MQACSVWKKTMSPCTIDSVNLDNVVQRRKEERTDNATITAITDASLDQYDTHHAYELVVRASLIHPSSWPGTFVRLHDSYENATSALAGMDCLWPHMHRLLFSWP